MDHPPSTPADTPASGDPGDRTQTIVSRREGSGDTPAAAARGTPPRDAPSTAAPPAALPIDDPDRYTLVGEHARGGLGRVVRATDTRLGRTVAVKELLKKGESSEALFVREALITARLQHPGIVPVIEAGRWPSGEPYYVMKLVEGRTLKDLIVERTSLEARLALLPQVIAVADALGYAHSQGVIHRDVKPANVVIGEFGETVVVDWGLAREERPGGDPADPTLRTPKVAPTDAAASASRSGSETVSGRVIGTPQYMSPEQARGDAVDARADVYSLGALLYEVLAGAAPYTGGGADTILQKVVAGPPRPLADAQPGVPPDLLAIVAKAMAREPADRYPNAKELAEDLKRFQTGQLVTAHEYGTMALIRRWLTRNRGPVAVGVIGVAIVVLVAIGMIARIVEERNVARTERVAADEARRAAERQTNALRELQAESSVAHDPTAAVAWLKELQIDDAIAGDVATLLDEALDAGVARHVLRERDWIYDVAFTPDGRSLATASKDGTVRLYDTTTGAPRVLGEHPGGVFGVAVTADGGELITGGLDGRVLGWPLAGGAPRELVRFGVGVKRMSVTDTGVLRAWSESEEFAAWQLPDGKPLFRIGTHDRLTGMVAGDLSPVDPTRWLVGYLDGRLTVLHAGAAEAELPKLARAPRVMQFAPDGVRVAIYDGAEVIVADLERRTLATLASLPAVPVRFFSWSPDGASIAVGGEFPELHVLAADPADQTRSRVLRGHTDSIYGVQWTRDGGRLLSASDDTTARVWDLVTGSVEVLRGHTDDVHAAAFSPDEATVATASLDGSVRVWHVGEAGARVLGGDLGGVIQIELLDAHTAMTVSTPPQVTRWDLRTGRRTTVLPRQDDIYKVTRPALSPRGDLATASGPDNDILLVPAEGEPRRLAGHTGRITGSGFDATGQVLFSASLDGTLRRWDLATGESRILRRGGAIELMLMAPTHDRMFVVGKDRFVVVGLDGVELRGVPAADVPVPPRWVARTWSADGRQLAVLAMSGAGMVWSMDTGAVLELENIGHHATNVAFSPDGRWLVGAMANRTAVLWDLTTGKIARRLAGHVDLVMNAAFSPDGTRLATTSYDRTVRIWDTSTWQVRVLRGHGGPVDALAWLDDDQLVTGARDGTIRIWPIPPLHTPTPDELRRQIARATTAVVGEADRIATPFDGASL